MGGNRKVKKRSFKQDRDRGNGVRQTAALHRERGGVFSSDSAQIELACPLCNDITSKLSLSGV